VSVLDFPDVNPDTGTSLSLKTNTTTFTSDLNNAVQTGKLVGDQWSVNMPFTNRTEKEGRKIKAFLARLGGVTGRFRMTPPDLNQLGTMQGAGVIDGAGQTGSVINTKGWDAGQANLFEAGDYIEFNGELKMVVDTAATDSNDYIEYTGTNLMPSPFDPSGWTGAFDVDTSYQSVYEPNPSGESFVGEFEYLGPGIAPLNHRRNNTAEVGGKYYTCMVIKPESGSDIGVRVSYQTGSSTFAAIRISAITGNYTASGEPVDVKVEELPNGYILFQIEYTASASGDLDIYALFYEVFDNGSQGGLPTVGDKIKCQAAFFGKANDWPASYLAGAAIPIAPPLRKATNDLDPIEATEPQAIFMLSDDNQASWDIQANYIHGASINCIEDVT